MDFPLPVTFDSNGSIGSRSKTSGFYQPPSLFFALSTTSDSKDRIVRGSNEFAELENMGVFIEILTVSDLQAEILVVPV